MTIAIRERTSDGLWSATIKSGGYEANALLTKEELERLIFSGVSVEWEVPV